MKRRSRLTKCLTRKSHSYLFLRTSVNPFMIGFVAAIFAAACIENYYREGLSRDTIVGSAMSVFFVMIFVAVYLAFFRARNSVRIYVFRHGLVYRDRRRAFRASRSEVFDLEQVDGPRRKWIVKTRRGSFDFDWRLISAAYLSRVISAWLRGEDPFPR